MAVDLTGQRFGRLTVMSRSDDHISKSGYRTVMWNCVCDCGNTKVIRGKCLTSGGSKSCGCFAKENMSNLMKRHGKNGTRLYAIWDSMRQRCLNKNHKSFHNYGGRGITISPEWDDFSDFEEWAVNNGYRIEALRGECTLDRIDVNEAYSPENCRWVNMKSQSNNKRDTIRLEHLGESHTLSEWADITGIKYQTIWKRYRNGKSIEEILKQ